MLDDVICALATPPGRAALAVIRVSGAGALDAAARVCPAARRAPARTATLARFADAAGGEIDRGLVTVFPGPHSYTGEDLVEFSCHGGLAVPARLLAALHAAGARPAAPGEFTRRAVLHGKLGLLEAEAVGDLVDATAPAQAAAALRQLDGHLTRRLDALRGALADLQALLAYHIDFPGEDDGPVDPARVATAHAALAADVERLLRTAPEGERLREGALVVLAGRPNAGKSSLFNALVGTERALVTPTPGTTRDAIEAHVTCEGWPVRLVDTAGLWEAEAALDRLGVEVSRRWLAAAECVVLCVEGTRPLDAEEAAFAAEPRTLVVRTKADLAAAAAPADDTLRVSALRGDGLDRLRRALAGRTFGHARADALEPALSRARHREQLARALDELRRAGAELPPRGDAVLAAHHLGHAAAALDELIGAIDREEVLDRVFAGFCVGK